jgi:hypothetical protein
MLKQKVLIVLSFVFVLLTVSAVSAQGGYYYAWSGASPQCTPTGIETGGRSFIYNTPQTGALIKRADYVNDVVVFAPEPYAAPVGTGSEDFANFGDVVSVGYPFTWRGTFTLVVDGTSVFGTELVITCTGQGQVPTIIKNWDVSQILLNNGFESGINNWSVNNPVGNKAKCNKEGKPPVAYEGNCAYQSKSGTPSKLSQPFEILLEAGDDLILDGWINAKGTVNASVKVVVKYASSNAKTSFDLAAPTTDYLGFSKVLEVTQSATKIKVQVINKGTSGKVLVDAVNLFTGRDFLIAMR